MGRRRRVLVRGRRRIGRWRWVLVIKRRRVLIRGLRRVLCRRRLGRRLLLIRGWRRVLICGRHLGRQRVRAVRRSRGRGRCLVRRRYRVLVRRRTLRRRRVWVVRRSRVRGRGRRLVRRWRVLVRGRCPLLQRRICIWIELRDIVQPCRRRWRRLLRGRRQIPWRWVCGRRERWWRVSGRRERRRCRRVPLRQLLGDVGVVRSSAGGIIARDPPRGQRRGWGGHLSRAANTRPGERRAARIEA